MSIAVSHEHNKENIIKFVDNRYLFDIHTEQLLFVIAFLFNIKC